MRAATPSRPKMAKVEEIDFSIKPENVTPAIPTSEWPLLLKNYDKRELLRPRSPAQCAVKLTSPKQSWFGLAISLPSHAAARH